MLSPQILSPPRTPSFHPSWSAFPLTSHHAPLSIQLPRPHTDGRTVSSRSERGMQLVKEETDRQTETENERRRAVGGSRARSASTRVRSEMWNRVQLFSPGAYYPSLRPMPRSSVRATRAHALAAPRGRNFIKQWSLGKSVAMILHDEYGQCLVLPSRVR